MEPAGKVAARRLRDTSLLLMLAPREAPQLARVELASDAQEAAHDRELVGPVAVQPGLGRLDRREDLGEQLARGRGRVHHPVALSDVAVVGKPLELLAD